MTAAQTSTAMSSYRINLIDKYDAWGMFLRLLKHVADTRGADTNEHLNEVRTGNSEKWNFSFARY